MRVVVFGATGMVGQGVLRECLLAADVADVVSVVRAPTGQRHARLREVVHADFTDLSPIADRFIGADACFFCLGVSSAGLDEAAYTRVTYDFTAAAVDVLADRNPELTFIYVSGAGTDSTEQGRSMWARVKGRTENHVFDRFPNGYAFRPGIIQPKHGAKSRTRLYRVLYVVLAPLLPVVRLISPNAVTNTEAVGRAMLRVARTGWPARILDNATINQAAAG